MNKREEQEMWRRIDALERAVRTERGILKPVGAKLLDARVYIAAIRRVLIVKNICTAAEFDAAVAAVKDSVTP